MKLLRRVKMMETADMEKNLNDYLKPVEAKDSFIVDSMEKAEWALKKIAEHKAECKRIDDFANEQIAKIQAWADEQAEAHENDVKFFEGLLMPFAAAELEGKKTKTLKMPSGKMSFKKATTYERDEKALLEFVKKTGMHDFVKIEEKLNWNEMKKSCIVTEDGKFVTEDGEIVPSVKIFISERFSVEV